LDIVSEFKECLLIEINMADGKNALLCTIYRSPNGKTENDESMIELINYVSKNYSNQKIILGDFTLGKINWSNWSTSGSNDSMEY